MDEKLASIHRSPLSARAHPRPRSPRRFITTLLFTLVLCSLVLYHLGLSKSPASLVQSNSSPPSPPSTAQQAPAPSDSKHPTRVPLEAHIMSKCPDARDCLRELVVPAMSNISEKVDFRLSFIGSVAPDDSITCKHGPSECLGDIFSLCVQSLYPNSSLISLGFTNCMLASYADIPARSLIESCANEHGVGFSKLNACISDEGKGLDLLKESVERSAAKGVVYSCTVRLADEIRCVRDSGAWKDCEGGSRVEDLVRDVESMYRKRNPGA